MKNLYTTLLTFVLVSFGFILTAPAAQAQSKNGVFPAAGSPANPKVHATWNHYNNYQGITDLTQKNGASLSQSH
jgi:hypothetical protein